MVVVKRAILDLANRPKRDKEKVRRLVSPGKLHSIFLPGIIAGKFLHDIVIDPGAACSVVVVYTSLQLLLQGISSNRKL